LRLLAPLFDIQKRLRKGDCYKNHSVKEQKKRKPKFSPAKYDATTSEEEKDDDIPPPPPPPPSAPAQLEGLRSPTDPFTLTELEDMHKKIVQKCAPIIDGFSAINIFEVSYVEQKLKEIKTIFKKDYDRNIQYVKFFKKANKQGKTEGNADVKGGAKGRKKK
jgi:pyruvate/2-oxoglutarate dehydrogenase complex dihydrolipoamide acyltransferase (E2) component